MPELQVKIPAHDGDVFGAYIAMPEVTPAPAIIVIQEIFGINSEIRAKCDELAAQGYVAIAPDLFWRMETGLELDPENEEELNKAFDLYNNFDILAGIEDLKTTLGYARNHKDVKNESVGCVGFCLGGFLAFAMAVESDVNAAVSYYGVNIPSMLERNDEIKQPLLMHIAEKDEFVPPESQQKIIDCLENHPHANFFTYEGEDHAFARGVSMNASENEGAGGLANTRTREFFDRTLKTQAEAA